MSTRRGGKKKAAQQKQQTIPAAAAAGLLVEEEDAAHARPAIPNTTTTTSSQKTPASPAIALAKQALTPVVTAAKAIITTAAAATTMLAPPLPAIQEDATVSTALHVDNNDQGQPGSPKSPQHTSQQVNPFLSNTAQKLFADDDEQPQQQQPQQQQQQQVQQMHSFSTPAHTPPQRNNSGSLDDDPDELVEPQQPTPTARLGSCLQHLHSSLGWKGGAAVLCALVLLIPLLAAVLIQGQQLKLQAQALQVQQHQVSAQAQALQALQHQLQETSAQLPSLMHATNSSLSALTAEQTALLDHLKGISNLTQQLAQEVSIINGSQHAGEQAWQLLTTGLSCAKHPGSPACTQEGPAAGAPPNASVILQALLSQQDQQDDTELRQQQQQQQLVQRQQELLQTLPHTIRQEVMQQLAVQLPPLDLALADCGGHVVFSTAINTTALRKQLGPYAARHSSTGSSRSMPSFLQQLLMPKARAANVSAPNFVVSSSSSNNTQELLLLHRVLLRPASKLLPSTCVPMLLGTQGQPAVIEIQLPQPAHIHSVTLHAADDHKSSSSTAPGPVTLALVNSTSCGGPAAACTQGHTPGVEGQSTSAGTDTAAELKAPSMDDKQQQATAGGGGKGVLKHGIEASLQERVLTAESFVAGRAVIHVDRRQDSAGGMLADRVVLILSGGGGGGGGSTGTSGPCMGRVSVQGRPTDPAGFC